MGIAGCTVQIEHGSSWRSVAKASGQLGGAESLGEQVGIVDDAAFNRFIQPAGPNEGTF